MIDLIIATKNPKKLKEIMELLADTPYRVQSLLDHPEIPDVPETGDTFAENAGLKARAALEATGCISLADDSGLEIDALGGRPGIHSSRFGGPNFTDRDKCQLVLCLMQDVPDEKRTARFRAAVCIAYPDGTEKFVEGSVEGRIARSEHGENGFGYDPIFYIPECKKTMAEIFSAEKNVISHRAKALKKVKDILREDLSK